MGTMREEKKAADDRNFRAFEEMMRAAWMGPSRPSRKAVLTLWRHPGRGRGAIVAQGPRMETQKQRSETWGPRRVFFFAASDRDSGRSSPLPPPPPGHGSDGTKCALLNELMRGDIWGDDEITIEDEGTRAYDELDAPSRSLMHIDMPVPPPSALIETDFDELD